MRIGARRPVALRTPALTLDARVEVVQRGRRLTLMRLREGYGWQRSRCAGRACHDRQIKSSYSRYTAASSGSSEAFETCVRRDSVADIADVRTGRDTSGWDAMPACTAARMTKMETGRGKETREKRGRRVEKGGGEGEGGCDGRHQRGKREHERENEREREREHK
eukprot:6212108-Pleurochrysis_carterae.AAC.3